MKGQRGGYGMDSKILHKISYGLYVIGAEKEGKFNGQIANTVFQVSSKPATVAISINKANLTNEFIEKSGAFSVSVLPQSTPLSFIGHFGFKSGRDIDKFQSVAFKQGVTGAPIILENTIGYLEAKVIASLEVETHTIFIGEIVDAQVFSDEEPMTYAYYHFVKRGGTPAAAPTHISAVPKEQSAEDKRKGDKTVQKYRCLVCGYEYDPAVGDPDSDIAPGTAFEDLPEDWICPVCGASKDQFEAVEE